MTIEHAFHDLPDVMLGDVKEILVRRFFLRRIAHRHQHSAPRAELRAGVQPKPSYAQESRECLLRRRHGDRCFIQRAHQFVHEPAHREDRAFEERGRFEQFAGERVHCGSHRARRGNALQHPLRQRERIQA